MDSDHTTKICAEPQEDPTEMTMRISAEEGAAAARRVEERRQENDALADDTEIACTTSLLRATSTQLLNYIAPRKKDHVNDAIESRKSGEIPPEEPVCFAADDQDLPPLDARYDFCDYLAEGGQGVLHTAKDRALYRRVVVKSLKKELLEQNSLRDAFLREARVTASLDHPAIVPVYGLLSDEKNGLHLAMKLLHGKSLKVYLNQVLHCYRTNGVFRYDEEDALLYRLDIFLRICDAMSYVHSRGVLHCDLKPENVILGEYREVYIMDWGIARKLDPNGQSAPQKQVMGTPRYTSPENLRNMPCDVRSDVYTLGVILFELVTLRAAFSARTVQGVIDAVKKHEVAPFKHRFGCHLPKDLTCIVRKAMAFEPEKRYQTVAALADDLRRYLRNAEVAANPDGPFDKLVRWCNRHKKIFFGGLLGVILLGVCGGTVGVFLNLARTAMLERERDGIKNSAYAAASLICNRLDRQFSHLSYLLSILNSDIALLLSVQPAGQSGPSPFLPEEEFRQHLSTCTGCAMVPYRSQPQDFAHAIVYPPPHEKTDGKTLRQLAPLMGRLRATLVRKLFLGARGGKSADVQKRFTEKESIIRNAYFSLQNGISVFYPGSADLPENYDGRTRSWYLDARKRKGACCWSEPYQDAGEQHEMIVTCSAEIVSPNGRSFGVSALDVALSGIAGLMKGQKHALAFALERVLLDLHGNELLSWTSASGSTEMTTRVRDGKLPQFRFPELFRRMSRMKYGTFLHREPRGTVLYVFCFIPSMKYLYVERHDFQRFLQGRMKESAARQGMIGAKREK